MLIKCLPLTDFVLIICVLGVFISCQIYAITWRFFPHVIHVWTKSTHQLHVAQFGSVQDPIAHHLTRGLKKKPA